MIPHKTAVRAATNAKLGLATAFLGIAALAAAGAGGWLANKPDLFIRSIHADPAVLDELTKNIKNPGKDFSEDWVALRVVYGNKGNTDPQIPFWLRLVFSPTLDVVIDPVASPGGKQNSLVAVTGYAEGQWTYMGLFTDDGSDFRAVAFADDYYLDSGWKEFPPAMNRYGILPSSYGNFVILIKRSLIADSPYRVRALIDNHNHIPESNEHNNSHVTQITL